MGTNATKLAALSKAIVDFAAAHDLTHEDDVVRHTLRTADAPEAAIAGTVAGVQ